MKKFLIGLIILLIVFFAGTFILNTYMVKTIKQLAQKTVRDTIDSQLEFSAIKVNPLKGIYVSNTSLTKLNENKPYLKIKKITIMPFYPSLLTTRKLLISLIIEDIEARLIREKNNQLDLSKLFLTKKQNARNLLPRNSFLIFKDLTIKNGSIEFIDQTVNFSKTFSGINLTAFFNFADIAIKFNYGEAVILKGTYGLLDKSINAVLNLSAIDLAKLSVYAPKISIKTGLLKKSELQISGKDIYTIKGTGELTGLSAAIPYALDTAPIEFSGNLIISPEIIIAGLFKEKPQFDYSSGIAVNNCALNNVPIVQNLNKITADLRLDKTAVTINKAITNIAGIDIRASGVINYAADIDNIFSIKTQINDDISNINTAAKKIGLIKFELNSKGLLDLTTEITGSLKMKKTTYRFIYKITNGEYGDFKNIQLSGTADEKEIALENMEFLYKKLPVKGTINVINLEKNPEIKTAISANMFSLRSQAIMRSKDIVIESIALDTPSSQAKGQGSINITDKRVQSTLSGKIEIADIIKLIELLDIKIETINQAKPKGAIEISAAISSDIGFNNPQINMSVAGKELFCYDLPVKNIYLELNKTAAGLTVKPLTSNICGGKIAADFKQDIPNQKIFINTSVDGFDLTQLREILNLKQKKLAGKVSFKMKLENSGLTEFNKLSGDGQLSVKDGDFWEINLLKGLGEFLFIPDFEDIKFDKGYSDLFFKDSDIIFKNIKLDSPSIMSIAGDGTISLKDKNNLNFELWPRFNQNLVDSSAGLKKYITDFLGKTGLNLTVTGTLKEPKYKINSIITNPLKSIKNIFQSIITDK